MKTLSDIEFHDRYPVMIDNFVLADDLRREAIRHIKYLIPKAEAESHDGDCYSDAKIQWIKYFFNIKEADLFAEDKEGEKNGK